MADSTAQAGDGDKTTAKDRERPPFTSRKPHEEARPYAWHKLTDEQYGAAAQVLGLLQGMVEQDWKPELLNKGPLDRLLPTVRDDRTNNVILIDGSRGSGKTSLLATLLSDLSNALRAKPTGDFKPLGWNGQVVPISFLNLYPLPASVHLLLHLVGSLENVVIELESRPAPRWKGPDDPPWKTSAAPQLASRERWTELFHAAASSWNGNLEQRAGSMDPEFYALELDKVERDRREISGLFSSFVDSLCQDMRNATARGAVFEDLASRQSDSYPLFLIALDDADLVPSRSTEILNLLSKLWHPRVAFLLTGESDQFLALLRNQFLGTLLDPLKSIDLPDSQWQIHDELARAARLAVATFERVIPPAHRCKINKLSDAKKLEHLSEPLQKLQATAGGTWPRNLYEYFDNELYATSALPDYIRPLLNLKCRLEDTLLAAETPETQPLGPLPRQVADFVESLWADLLDSEPLLGAEREILQKVVQVTEDGHLVVNGDLLECRYSARRAAVVPCQGWTLSVMANHSLTVARRGSLRGEAVQILPDSLKGAFKLAVDLVADIPTYQFPRGTPTPDGFQCEPVIVRWDALEEAGMRRGFTWPLPDWEEFLSFSLVHLAWDETLSCALFPAGSQRRADPARLARWFLHLVITVAKTRLAEAKTRLADNLLVKDVSWPNLAKELLSLVDLCHDETMERQRTNYSWALGRAGLLATPESGLPAKEAGEWLKSLEGAFTGKQLWQKAQAAMLWERREQVRRRWSGEEPDPRKVAELLKTIDTACGDHPWVQKIEAAKPQSRQIPARRKAAPAAGAKK